MDQKPYQKNQSPVKNNFYIIVNQNFITYFACVQRLFYPK